MSILRFLVLHSIFSSPVLGGLLGVIRGHKVSKTAVWKWVGKLSEKVSIKPLKICRSLIESVYSYFKQRMKVFFNNITSNPLDRSERFRRSMLC